MANWFAKLRSYLRRDQNSSYRKPRQASIFNQVMLNIILVVIITVIISGVPAILVLRYQLEQTAFLHVHNTQSATLALYQSEQSHLYKLVELLCERPTLNNIMRNKGGPSLNQYLDTLREDTAADVLGVINLDYELTQSGSVEIPLLPSDLTNFQMPYVNLISLRDPAGVAIIALDQIRSHEENEDQILGWVVGLQVLDNEFMQTLFQQTGLEQSIVLDGMRVASSLSNLIDWSIDSESISNATEVLPSCCIQSSIGNNTFYVGMAPLTDNLGHTFAMSEVALPGDTIRRQTQIAISYLLGSSIVIALFGLLPAVVITRRFTRPLRKLAHSAEHMGFGDLNTPVPIGSGYIEIDQLASQLERSRKYLNQIVFFTRSELKRLAHILGATKEGVVTLNNEGVITWFNLETSRITGFKPMEIFHKHHSQIFRPDGGDTPPLDEILKITEDQGTRSNVTILDAQGQPVTISVAGSQLNDERAERSDERVITIREISSESKIDQQQGEFLSYIAHEFRTPLASISAVIELLEESIDMSPEELNKLVNTIRLSSSHLSALVNNLLESTIIEAGYFQLNYRTIRLDKLLANIREIMTPLINRHQQTLEFETPKYLPTIIADPERLTQALVNLLENASKFSPICTQIILNIQFQKDFVTFTVLDSGPGFPEGEVENLFKRFASNQPRGAQYGIGLGLPVVKSIVEAHGGKVFVENRPKGGALVGFTLPLKPTGAQEKLVWQRFL